MQWTIRLILSKSIKKLILNFCNGLGYCEFNENFTFAISFISPFEYKVVLESYAFATNKRIFVSMNWIPNWLCVKAILVWFPSCLIQINCKMGSITNNNFFNFPFGSKFTNMLMLQYTNITYFLCRIKYFVWNKQPVSNLSLLLVFCLILTSNDILIGILDFKLGKMFSRLGWKREHQTLNFKQSE